ncbi:MAG: hypothetical protein H6657_00080 [Ardenticatenaceae bacterium]|nr:hypothetical protein [Ardenticatenaceae bacterium]
MILMIGWQNETEMEVLEVVDEAYQLYLISGDIVLAIDGRPVQRGEEIFSPPIKSFYNLTLIRGNVVVSQDVPTIHSSFYDVWRISTGILSIAMWSLGFLSVVFARSGQRDPVLVGLSFQLTAAGIVSPGPSQLGAFGAWLVGQVLIWLFPLIVLYLGFLPRSKPLNGLAKKMLGAVFIFLLILATMETVEVIFLYPTLSFQKILGFQLVTILTISTGTAILFSVAILFGRLLKAPKGSYERQQLLILFVFILLAFFPLFTLVILPVSQNIFVPYPFIYSLLLLAPVGYFFVLHRQGHLVLEPIFSRIITLVIMILSVGMAYFMAMYLLNEVFQIRPGEIGKGAFIFALFGFVIVGQKHVQAFVELLFYGRDGLDFFSFATAQARLSANPEPSTISDMIFEVATCLQIPQTTILVRTDNHYAFFVGNMKEITIPISHCPETLQLRSRSPQMFHHLPAWVEMSLPIAARGDTIGIYLLSRPVHGYFNTRQVEALQKIADLFAFGLLVVNLMEMMQASSSRMLYEKERQRQKIATEIHNEPLHTLTAVMMQLQSNTSDETIQSASHAIRRVTNDLRRIIADLRPPALKESIEWIVRQVVRNFEETHENILVTLQTDISSEKQATEQTKSAFYYILTEALNNISKHAQCSKVSVTLTYCENNMALEIEDDGIGITTSQSITELLRLHHIGITDMYRWASIGGGTLLLEQGNPAGTRVKLTLPI